MKQSEKLTQLLELMQANPELPVIPCVDGDVVSGDEYYCWLGSWGESAVQEFVIGRERTYYREDDISEMNDVLCEHYDPELVDNMTEEETRAAYNALPWKKAIFVDVHQYEEEPMPRYDVFLEGRTESSTRYFAVSVMADDPKEAEFLGHEAGRVKHQECDEIEVVGVMSVTSNLNAGKGRLCWRIPLKERSLKFVKEAIKNGRKKAR